MTLLLPVDGNVTFVCEDECGETYRKASDDEVTCEDPKVALVGMFRLAFKLRNALIRCTIVTPDSSNELIVDCDDGVAVVAIIARSVAVLVGLETEVEMCVPAKCLMSEVGAVGVEDLRESVNNKEADVKV